MKDDYRVPLAVIGIVILAIWYMASREGDAYDSGYKTGYDIGYEEGYEKGRDVGYDVCLEDYGIENEH